MQPVNNNFSTLKTISTSQVQKLELNHAKECCHANLQSTKTAFIYPRASVNFLITCQTNLELLALEADLDNNLITSERKKAEVASTLEAAFQI